VVLPRALVLLGQITLKFIFSDIKVYAKYIN